MPFGYGIGALAVLILDIYCIYLLLTSGGDPAKRLIWIIVILLLPLLGAILYLLIGRRTGA